MTAITYTAKRSIIPGHTVDTVYKIECEMDTLTPFDKPEKQENKSQGGQVETILHSIVTGYQFTSGFIHNDDYAQWLEFTRSVAGGESFIFDAFGTIAAADNEETVLIQGDVTWSRINYYYKQAAFRMRLI